MKNLVLESILKGEDVRIALEVRIPSDVGGDKIQADTEYILVNKRFQQYLSGGTLHEPLYATKAEDAIVMSGDDLLKSEHDWTVRWDAVISTELSTTTADGEQKPGEPEE